MGQALRSNDRIEVEGVCSEGDGDEWYSSTGQDQRLWVSSGSQLNSEEVLPGSAVAGAFCPLPKGLLGGEVGFVTAPNTGHEK